MSIELSVKKSFGTSFSLNISFCAGNEVLALLGGSGCGKSMTLRMIAGIVTPDEGHISVDGVTFFDSEKKINLTPQERQVGLLFQNYALFNNRTVEENVAMGIREKMKKEEKLRRADAFLEKFQLAGLEKRLPRELSGGQQQRVALARILIGTPRILMLDEPFSALDSYLRWEMELELKQLLEEFDGTTVLVSHSRDEVYRIAHSVCVVEAGTSEPVISVQELFDHPTTRAAALLSGCKNYAHVVPEGETCVRVTDWDITLECGRPVPQNTSLLGIRRHYVRPAVAEGAENCFFCRVERVIDDVFSTVVIARPESARADAEYATVELELSKTEWRALGLDEGDRFAVVIAPKDLLLLH